MYSELEMCQVLPGKLSLPVVTCKEVLSRYNNKKKKSTSGTNIAPLVEIKGYYYIDACEVKMITSLRDIRVTTLSQ